MPPYFILMKKSLVFTLCLSTLLCSCARSPLQNHLEREKRVNKVWTDTENQNNQYLYTHQNNYETLYAELLAAGRIVEGATENCFKEKQEGVVINYYGFILDEIHFFREYACKPKTQHEIKVNETIKGNVYSGEGSFKEFSSVAVKTTVCRMKDQRGMYDWVISEVCL